VDGTFTLTDVPDGTNIPIVIQAGKWRLQSVIPTITPCTQNAIPATNTTFPQTQTQGDIPQIAVATGSVDALECVLRKVGIADSEFTAPTGGGRVHLYAGSESPGAKYVGTTTLPSESTLVSSTSTMSNYDVIMFPCQGGSSGQATTTSQQNLISWVGSGGRVFATHYSYAWLYDVAPFSGTANWDVGIGDPPNGTATVNQSFTSGATLAQWLQNVGASTTLGQISVSTLRLDQTGVIAPTQSWLTLNNSFDGVTQPVMQLTFNTPVNAPPAQQCGRVLFNEYHVETATINSSNDVFPAECPAGAMTPQEKLLEYSLFDLSTFVQPVLLPQTITFAPLPSPVVYGIAPLLLVATGGGSGNSVTFTVTGPATLNGNTLVITGGGTVVVTANQLGNASYEPAAPVSQTVIVNTATPVLSITAGPSPIFLQNPVTLTASVSSTASTPTGTVTFSYGTTTIGSATLVDGVATLTTTSLPVGVFTISAAYSGDSNFVPVSGVTTTETVMDFSLSTTSATTDTVLHGGTATYNFIISPIGGSVTPAAISLAVTGYREDSVVTFTPTSIPAASGNTNITLSIQVPTFPTTSHNDSGHSDRTAIIAGIGLFLLPFGRKLNRASKGIQRLLTILVLLAGAIATVGLMGCGSGWPTQVRGITVTATSAALTHTNYLSLTEQ